VTDHTNKQAFFARHIHVIARTTGCGFVINNSKDAKPCEISMDKENDFCSLNTNISGYLQIILENLDSQV